MTNNYSLTEKARLLISHYLRKLVAPGQKRGFDGAKGSRLLADWVKSSTSLDEDIKGGLTTLRARSRDLCQNNDYGRRFLKLLAANIVGPSGIRLQCKVMRPRSESGKGVLDTETNLKIEAGWRDWCRKDNCTVTGRLSFVDVQRMFIQGVARDGEGLIRKVMGPVSPFGFALQLIEPDYLDHDYSVKNQNIKMAVEYDQWKKPIAYHISRENPLEYGHDIGQVRRRWPANQIIHEFIIERPEQTRGYPWTASAMRRLHQVGKYEHTELVAARAGAAKMGFYVNPQGDGLPYDDKDDQGNLIEEVSPGKLQQLPVGYDFKPFNIDHPNTGFDTFVKAILRGAAAGLDVSYSSLSNDLAEANYSSLRQGALTERDAWMILQGWMVEHFCQPVFAAWLPQALASGRLDLPAEYNGAHLLAGIRWQPRRWAWIDPLKDTTSNEKGIGIAINSRTRIAAEQGLDIDDIFSDLAREAKLAESLGLSIINKPQPKGPENATQKKSKSNAA